MTLDAGDGTQGTGAPAPVLHPGDPRRVGGVRLLGRLGEGGMGVVFLGRAESGRLVAVKVIRADYARDSRFRARFAAEAAAARRVARFCTAQVLDAGQDGDLAYLVTEFIEGPTLTAALSQDGPMRGSTLESLAIGIAAALNGIHAAGVVHRDLKPSNVLLSRVGPKVIDFGIARALDALEGLTESGDIVGTPAYMAPEQFRGTATTATDIFSWGAVITFAATGRPPFRTGTPYELMNRVLSEPPDLGGLEGPLRGLVAGALDKDPDRRPTARALLLALVGDTADPIDATSRILSTQWTPPPVAATRLDVAPTRLDDGAAAGPLRGQGRSGARMTPTLQELRRSWQRRRPDVADRAPARRSWQRVLVPAVAVVLAVAAVVLWGSLRDRTDDRGTPGGDASASASAGPGASAPGGPSASGPVGSVPPSTGSGTVGAAAPIAIGVRVPQRGAISLGVGEVRRYRLHLDAERKVYVTGDVCSDLVPWRLSYPDGRPIGSNTLGCRQSGPYALPAGDYDLFVGGPGVDGKYALTIVDR
ncbi:putative Ser/Thr protein kinase [Allocatelliglobosispora scoriae]|uniref:Putative Ser/Thr protein kinase n=1 Tax=Allocatelliglobosispora scoriae TaxID=643052 RepID=A0A841C2Y3_9ACTN|nr:serine/threonine-protein kinase [Allocatelliglobosispora scoriae]MBB5873669.1 putative Ser/Thr protein kinase [Allocatelliglobosispora scoriae]